MIEKDLLVENKIKNKKMNPEKTKILALVILLCVVSIITTFSIYLMSTNQTQKKKWNYEVKGYVIVDGKKKPAIWYTDTLYWISEDSCGYKNSDGTKVNIKTPYLLIDHTLDK